MPQTFFEAYRAALVQTVIDRPQEYALRPDEDATTYAHRVADKMIASMQRAGNVNGVNTDSLSFRRACRAVGIKPTRIAMNERIQLDRRLVPLN